jgi:hypothetical protein
LDDDGLFDDRSPFAVLAFDVVREVVAACRPGASSDFGKLVVAGVALQKFWLTVLML